MTEQKHTYTDTSGVECYYVEHLQPHRLPDGTLEMRPTGQLIGKPVHHDTDENEIAGGLPHRQENTEYIAAGMGIRPEEVELRPIDKTIYGRAAHLLKGR